MLLSAGNYQEEDVLTACFKTAITLEEELPRKGGGVEMGPATAGRQREPVGFYDDDFVRRRPSHKAPVSKAAVEPDGKDILALAFIGPYDDDAPVAEPRVLKKRQGAAR